jgi:hypothetical protein
MKASHQELPLLQCCTWLASTMHSFSIHLIAEIKKISRDNIDAHYDQLEAVMLEDFYKFVQEYQDH